MKLKEIPLPTVSLFHPSPREFYRTFLFLFSLSHIMKEPFFSFSDENKRKTKDPKVLSRIRSESVNTGIASYETSSSEEVSQIKGIAISPPFRDRSKYLDRVRGRGE